MTIHQNQCDEELGWRGRQRHHECDSGPMPGHRLHLYLTADALGTLSHPEQAHLAGRNRLYVFAIEPYTVILDDDVQPRGPEINSDLSA